MLQDVDEQVNFPTEGSLAPPAAISMSYAAVSHLVIILIPHHKKYARISRFSKSARFAIASV
jgi:hypothetical protein